MLIKKINELLKDREFVSVATCDFKGKPNAVPKFLLKVEAEYIYLVDYTIGKTWENLKENPQVSLSLMDTGSLTGYRINGSVEIIEAGPLYKKALEELREKEVSLSAERVIEGLARGKAHKEFEVEIPDRFVVFKIKVLDVIAVSHRGQIFRSGSQV